MGVGQEVNEAKLKVMQSAGMRKAYLWVEDGRNR